MKKVRGNRNGKPMKQKPKLKEEKKKFNIKERWKDKRERWSCFS